MQVTRFGAPGNARSGQQSGGCQGGRLHHMVTYHPVAGVGTAPIAGYVAVMLRERGMRAVAIGTQLPMLQDGKADTTGTAGETVDHLPCKAVAGTARHAAVGADAQLRPTAKSRMDHTVVTDEIEYVIIQYGREHGGKNQRYRSEFPYISLAV